MFHTGININDIVLYFADAIISAEKTRLKKKIENNSTWEDVFYQSEWAKINSSWVIFIFSLFE